MRHPLGVIFSILLLLGVAGTIMAGDIRSGIVVSAAGADNYTYIEVDEQGQIVWLAANHLEVAAGDRIEFAGGVPMTDFHSKEMDRTFENLLMVTRVRVANDAQESDSEAMPDDDLHRGLMPQSPAAAEPATGEVVRREGEIAIADLFAKRTDLAGQTVAVRGRVVKVSPNILGRTWLTLSDGTGDAPDNVLRVITSDTATIGQVLSVRGTVKTDVDLGSGYRYKLLIDEAELGD